MNNLSVKKQYIIINAIMCLVVAVIAIACITFTSMPTRPTTAATADNDIPLSDTSYDGNGSLCGKNLFNMNAPKHPRYNTISANNSFGYDFLTVSTCNTTAYLLPRIKLKLKPMTCYTVSFFVNFYDTLLPAGTTAPGTVESRFRFLENDMEHGYSFCESMSITGISQKFVYTFTTDNSFNFNYISFGYFSPISLSYNLTLRDFQVEEGSTATSYEPFIGSNAVGWIPQKFDYSYYKDNFGANTRLIGGFTYSKNYCYKLDIPFSFLSGFEVHKRIFLGVLSQDKTRIEREICPSGKAYVHNISVVEYPTITSGSVIVVFYKTTGGASENFTVNDCKGIDLLSLYYGDIDGSFDSIHNNGYQEGYKDGNTSGYNDGHQKGYDEGYTKGDIDGASTWNNLFPSIFGAIGGFFKNMLDINVLGMNLLSILGGVGAIIISLILIRLVVK